MDNFNNFMSNVGKGARKTVLDLAYKVGGKKYRRKIKKELKEIKVVYK